MNERITHDFMQGSDAWLEFRLTHFGASEAAAMLGLSPKVKRTELLHMKHAMQPQEFSDWVQANILDKGHEIEALARPIVEESIGEELYPMVFSLAGTRISASCDGLNMIEDTAWENKQRNQELYELIKRGELPEEHMPQAQQVLMVTGASRLIFTCSDGTESGTVEMTVLPDEAWFDRIRAGWAQFEKDLAEYKPLNLPDKPHAEPIKQLPALAVQIRGEVVASNLSAFKAAAEAFIAGIKTELSTDEDFVNAAEKAKFCEEAETRLDTAKSSILAQTASVDELMRTVDHIREQFRQKRLALDKLVTRRKDEIKAEALADRRAKYSEHVNAINAELKVVTINVPSPDWILAAKNKRTLASLYDALDTALANGKIEADAAARDLRAKLDWYKQHAEHAFLFRDLQTIIQKPTDDFQLAVTTRIAEHKRQEEAKAEAKRKADEAAAQQVAPAVVAAPATVAVAAPGRGGGMAVARTATTTSPTLRLGQINERLSPITLTAEGLATLGITPSATEKNAKLYHETDFVRICEALVKHVNAVCRDAEVPL